MKVYHNNYIIATIPRTGSFLMCEGLQATGIAGLPQEYGAPEDIATWRNFHGYSTHAEYFFRFPNLCRTPNGVFGAKLMWSQFVAWGRDARHYLHNKKSTPDIICAMVGAVHVIRLVRRDIVRQAISWVRARETSTWSRQEGDPVTSSGTVPPRYNSTVLQQAIEEIERQNQYWEAALSLFDAPILTVSYEDLAASYRAIIAQICKFWNSVGGICTIR
jgi:trehalose 2-sulfotransferase